MIEVLFTESAAASIQHANPVEQQTRNLTENTALMEWMYHDLVDIPHKPRTGGWDKK